MLRGASFAWACNIIQLRGNRHVRLGADMIPWQTAIATVPLAVLAWVRDGAPAFLAVPDAWPIILYTEDAARGHVHRNAVRTGDRPGRVVGGVP
ncbi:hypothetical protein G6F68_020784 [Rhizopus microsporus]|nr:hypothetical protein G6F68_020784 [Rhizopus microsporus]